MHAERHQPGLRSQALHSSLNTEPDPNPEPNPNLNRTRTLSLTHTLGLTRTLSQVALQLSRAVAHDTTKKALHRHQLLLRRRGLLNGRGLTMSCLSARCCRQMHKDLHRCFRSTIRP